MNRIIEKYEAKLDYLNKAVEQTNHLMDVDTLDMMNDMKTLITEVIEDFKKFEQHIKDAFNSARNIQCSDEYSKTYDWNNAEEYYNKNFKNN
jgi:hypothetical protein